MDCSSQRPLVSHSRVTNPAREQSHRLRGLQDRLLQLLGNRVEARAEIVQRMLQRDANEAVSYWLQLCVSVGIATLGLVVGSAAVVIGAMLIAPLMGPILALAMGLATGSPSSCFAQEDASYSASRWL